jgi:hypothetical protein
MLFDVQALVVPPHDVAEVGKGNARIFAQHLFDRDPEPLGARLDILEFDDSFDRLVLLWLGRSEVAQRVVQRAARVSAAVFGWPRLPL